MNCTQILLKWKNFSFTLSTLLTFSITATASLNSGTKNSKIIYQIEAGFNLTEPLANRIKNSFKKVLTAQKRADYYIDIYNGEKLLISESSQSYKVRLKAKKDKWILQANTKLSVQTHSCSDGTSFKIREKNVGELSLSEAEADNIIKTDSETYDLISNQKLDQFSKVVSKFDKFMLSLHIPLFDKILEVTNNEEWIMIPSHFTKKIKWSSIKAPKTNIEWSLTEAQDYISSKFVEAKYEIEFQTEDHTTSVDEFATVVCQFMTDLNASSEEFIPQRQDLEKMIRTELLTAAPYLEFHR